MSFHLGGGVIKKAKWKWLAILFAGLSLFLVLLAGSGVEDNIECGSNGTATTGSIQLDDKGKEENAKQIITAVAQNIENTTIQGLCGMVGNFEQESQLDPKAIERKHDPLSGHGIAQWTATRTTDLKNYAKEKNKDWTDLGIQVEFLIKELKGTEKNGQNALRVTDVTQATADWQTTFERAGIPAMDNRVAYANKWYAKFGNMDSIAKNATENATEGALVSNSVECGSSAGDADGNIVKMAKSMNGWFSYSQPKRKQFGDPMNPDKNGFTDCSSFVWLTLTRAGYKTPADVGWFTGSMASDAKGAHQWLKQIPESEAEAGDVVIVNQGSGVGNAGHTAIITEKWRGNDTKIIESGGDPTKGAIHESTFQYSFMSLLNGGDLVLARPIKK